LDDDHPFEDHVRAAETALELAKRKILSGNYRLFILDEINYAIKLGLISTESVLELIKIKPKQMTLVLTGNHADSQIISISDLVTEMKEIKHPFKAGIKAQRGIDL
jgi:cob(I)alamin adenosyltransferase